MIDNIEKDINAYTEVYEILSNLPEKEFRKIPNNLIQSLKENMNMDYTFEFDIKRPLEYQNISDKAMLILAVIYRDYLATEVQKNKIINFEKNKRIELDKEAREKYNIDVFEQRKIERGLVENKSEVETMINNSESTQIANIVWYTKIFNLIRRVLKLFNK